MQKIQKILGHFNAFKKVLGYIMKPLTDLNECYFYTTLSNTDLYLS